MKAIFLRENISSFDEIAEENDNNKLVGAVMPWRPISLNIDIFEYADLDESNPVLRVMRRSPYKYEDVLSLLHYKNHFMYIIDLDKLGHVFVCKQCEKLWKTGKQLHRHERTCNGGLCKHRYAGGVYNPPESILKQLYRFGVHVDTSFVFPYRTTYDFEVYFSKCLLSVAYSL